MKKLIRMTRAFILNTAPMWVPVVLIAIILAISVLIYNSVISSDLPGWIKYLLLK